MSKTYRIGIIGVGGIADSHAAAVGDLPHAKLVAGSCRTEEKGRKFADKYKCAWYPTYEAMLEKEKPDVVLVTTPSGAHLEPVKACAARGIHVLCEKPLEITTARVDEMIAAARKGGIQLGGVFQSRFEPVLQRVRDAVAAGRFGSLSLAMITTPWWRDDAYYAPHRWQGKLALDGGGALINQTIHGVDALQWVVGAAPDLRGAANPVAEVFAYTAKRAHDPKLIEVEDTAVALLRFRNGALGQVLAATSMYPGGDRRMMIGGRDGTTELQERTLVRFEFRDKKPEDEAAMKEFSGRATQTGASDPLAISHIGHTRNLGAFLEALNTGATFELGGPQARVAVEIIEKIYESARTGKPARIN